MQLFFSLFFIICPLFFVEAQSLIPVPFSKYDLNQFNWKAFSNSKNIKEHIDYRNSILQTLGADDFYVKYIGREKASLIRLKKQFHIEKKLKGKKFLDSDTLQSVEIALEEHSRNINDIENHIRFYAGLPVEGFNPVYRMVGSPYSYQKGFSNLYTFSYAPIFDLIEKKDEKFYSTFAGNDEAYATYIFPYVEKICKNRPNIS